MARGLELFGVFFSASRHLSRHFIGAFFGSLLGLRLRLSQVRQVMQKTAVGRHIARLQYKTNDRTI